MKNLRFRTQLIIGFSIVLLFSLLIAFISLIQLRKISSYTELIYSHPLTVSNKVKDIQINISIIHRSMNDIVAAKDSDYLNNSIKLIAHYDSLIHLDFDIVKERFLGDKSLVESTYKAYLDWEINRNRVIELKKDGNYKETLRLKESKGLEQLTVLFERAKVLTDFAQSEAYEFYQNSRKIEKQVMLRFFLSISALLILSIIIALVISNNISQPISKFVAEINTIFKDKDIAEGKFHLKTEQELLSSTVLELKASYKKLMHFNEELEKQVKIQTKELSENQGKLQEQIEEYLTLNEEYQSQNEELLTINELLKTSQTRLEELNATKDKLFSIISHDLKSPFNSILGFSELLIENIQENNTEKSAEMISVIHLAAKHTLNLLDNLLAWSKAQTGQTVIKPEYLSLPPIIQEILDTLNSSALIKNISLSYPISKDIILYADPNMLRTVLRNLVSNAIKFTNSGGKVDISTISDQNQIKINVSDNGVGMSEEIRSNLFKIDTTVTTPGTAHEMGSGLGLILCKEFAEKNGGRIWVESEIGKGSTFTFTVPISLT